MGIKDPFGENENMKPKSVVKWVQSLKIEVAEKTHKDESFKLQKTKKQTLRHRENTERDTERECVWVQKEKALERERWDPKSVPHWMPTQKPEVKISLSKKNKISKALNFSCSVNNTNLGGYFKKSGKS